MSILNAIQTYWTIDHPQISQVARLSVTQSGGSTVLWVHDAAGHSTSSLTLGAGFVSGSQFQHSYYGASQSQYDIQLNGTTRGLDETTVDHLVTGAGPSTTYLDRVGFYGNTVAVTGTSVGGSDYVFVSPATGSGIFGYQQSANGSLSLVETVPDTSSLSVENIVAMAVGSNLGYATLVTASHSTDTLSLFYIDAAGQLTLKDDIGPEDLLPINAPSAVELLTVSGQTYVIAGASGSNSLTVLSLGRNGAMEFSDQVIDTLDTRFQNVSALATTVWDGVGLIAAAGSDGGISLFQLLPNGRLVLRETLVDQTTTALSGVAQLEFAEVGNSLQIVALSTGDQGITRLSVDLPSIGVITTAQYGTSLADVLTAPSAGGPVWAQAGNDIVIDGAGSDTLWGGTGADLFIFTPDGQTDTVADFQLGQDRIDLSAYPLLHSIADIGVFDTSQGVRLDLGDEDLLINASSGSSLNTADITDAILFNAAHVFIPDPIAVQGSPANDMFYWSPSSAGMIDGGAGFDAVDYSAAGAAIVVALDGSQASSGAATGDEFTGIERIIATDFDDTVIGNHLANMIEGNPGDDVIWGNSGADWLVPGAGNDTVQGGPGTDMVSYVDSALGINANLVTGTVTTGGYTDDLTSIESLTGSIFGDYILGNSADNRLRGLGDYDWMVGSGGADTFDGGTGRDMVSYVGATSAVTVDLGQGLGSAGQAAQDRYISIERVTGSSFADQFYGSDGADDFRGLGGNDWFVGSDGGKDRYYGGSGRDTVAYTNAPEGIVASLLLGRGSAGQARSDLYFEIENLTGSSHNDQLTGDHQANILRGMWGADVLRGNNGNDHMTGGGSNDILDGGSGYDYAYFQDAASGYEVFTSGNYTYVDRIASGGDGRDQLINIEVLVFADQTIYL